VEIWAGIVPLGGGEEAVPLSERKTVRDDFWRPWEVNGSRKIPIEATAREKRPPNRIGGVQSRCNDADPHPGKKFSAYGALRHTVSVPGGGRRVKGTAKKSVAQHGVVQVKNKKFAISGACRQSEAVTKQSGTEPSEEIRNLGGRGEA